MNAAELKRQGFSIAEMRRLARRALPRPVFDFADGGAEDERTLRRNEAAFDEIRLLPRPLDGSARRDLSVTLFGQQAEPARHHRTDRPRGPVLARRRSCSARAAAAAGTAYCLSHGSVCTLEDLAALGTSPRWMQVFVYRDRGFTRELAERAAQAEL